MESQLVRSLLALGIICTIASTVCGQRKGHKDDYLYNQTVIISGTVTTSFAGEADEAISVSQGLLFQRVGCKLCLIGTTTDTKGRYQINVGRGEYRIIVRDGTNEGHLLMSWPPISPG